MKYKDIKALLDTTTPGWNEPSFLLKDPACIPGNDLLFLCILESLHGLLQGRIEIPRLSEVSTAKEVAVIALKRASVEGGRDLCNWYDIVALGNLKRLMNTQETMVAVLRLFYNLKQLDFGELEHQMGLQTKHDTWRLLSNDEIVLEEISPLLPIQSQKMVANTMGITYLNRLLSGYYQTLYRCKQKLVAYTADCDVSEAWTTILWNARRDFLQKTVFKDYVVSLAECYDEHHVGDLSNRSSYSNALLDFLNAGMHTRTESYLVVPPLPSSFGFEFCTSHLDALPIPETYPQQSTQWFNQMYQCFTWHWSATNAKKELWSKERFDKAYKCISMLEAINGYKNVMSILERMESFSSMTEFDEKMAVEEYLGREAASMIHIEYHTSMHAYSADYNPPYYVPKDARLTKGQLKSYGRRSLAVKTFVMAARPNFLPNQPPKGKAPRLKLKGLPSKYFT